MQSKYKAENIWKGATQSHFWKKTSCRKGPEKKKKKVQQAEK